MISVLVIGDPHFKVGNVQESEEMVKKLIELAKEKKPTFIVCLGDILHRHETIHVSPLMRAEEMIRLLSEIAPTFLIVGNHDRPNNSNYLTNEHPFNAMKKWNNTYIVDKVVDSTIKNKRFLFVPYVPPGKFMDALNTIKNPLKETTAIFAHQEFYGAKMGAIISQSGDKWSLDNPPVISGHIHDYDKPQSNIIYVGTPFQHSFGDSAKKTISIFNFGDIDGEILEDRNDLGLTKRIIVYLTPEEIHTYEPPVNKLVKLVIRGDEASIKAVSKMEKISELKKRGIKIAFKSIDNKLTESKGPVLRMRYKDRLYTEIRKDKNQLVWFDKLFSDK